MNKIMRKKWFVRLISLLFALLLYFIANSRNVGMLVLNSSQNYTVSLQDIPIEFVYDEDKYYISGYQDTASVTLESANKILLNREENEQTRSVKLVADLSNKKTGTFAVELQAQNLNEAVQASITPKTVYVTMEKKETKEFEVQAIFDDTLFSDGYSLGDVKTSPTKVKITSGSDSIQNISKVVAVVGSETSLTSSFSEKVKVQALDQDGEPIAAEIEPSEVTVQATISAPKKKVSVRLIQEGDKPSTVSNYSFSYDVATVEISGAQSLLDDITEIELPVDISGIDKEVSKMYPLNLPTGIQAVPSNIQVRIVPVFFSSSSEKIQSSQSQSSQSSTSEDQSSQTSETTSETTDKTEETKEK